MASWIFVTIACCLVNGLQAQTNYCTTTYCRTGVQNVGCNPPATPGGVGCNGMSPAVVTMDSTLQTLVLSEHNTRRSQLALGQLASFLPATRMPTITPAIGHFTQMASDQTSKIGCAMQYWLDGDWETYYFVCNYGVTNVVGRPTYKSGTVASGCTTGRNPVTTLNGLCSTAETINPVPNPVA
uniref:SCP domain-containing protein n=1 Tax=Anopheles minimus TaxID=112268 RepID=A0A182WC66_9DIPT